MAQKFAQMKESINHVEVGDRKNLVQTVFRQREVWIRDLESKGKPKNRTLPELQPLNVAFADAFDYRTL